MGLEDGRARVRAREHEGLVGGGRLPGMGNGAGGQTRRPGRRQPRERSAVAAARDLRLATPGEVRRAQMHAEPHEPARDRDRTGQGLVGDGAPQPRAADRPLPDGPGAVLHPPGGGQRRELRQRGRRQRVLRGLRAFRAVPVGAGHQQRRCGRRPWQGVRRQCLWQPGRHVQLRPLRQRQRLSACCLPPARPAAARVRQRRRQRLDRDEGARRRCGAAPGVQHSGLEDAAAEQLAAGGQLAEQEAVGNLGRRSGRRDRLAGVRRERRVHGRRRRRLLQRLHRVHAARDVPACHDPHEQGG
mmetsp:Transcript_54384/g.168859  ORF Transcript_54384/g.168859 Transcript_54384/m.168859 type:complete len:300 (-) Transcript_54384:351-1250(-)